MALLKNGFPGESVVNGSVIAVKTHDWGQATREQFDSAILLVRDPFEIILAEFYRRSRGHIGHASQEKFSRNTGQYWQDFVIFNRDLRQMLASTKLADLQTIQFSDLQN
jgi:hypothetical protein